MKKMHCSKETAHAVNNCLLCMIVMKNHSGISLQCHDGRNGSSCLRDTNISRELRKKELLFTLN